MWIWGDMKWVYSILPFLISGFLSTIGYSQQTSNEKKFADYPTFIDQLENGESYLIQTISSGCFHYSSDSIIVYKENDRYFAEYKMATNELDFLEIETLRTFEKELQFKPVDGGCTSSDLYQIIYKDEIIQAFDSSCDWWGIQHLKENLGW